MKLSVDLDIKAEREDIPQVTESVKQQLAGAFGPTNIIHNGHRPVPPLQQLIPSPAENTPPAGADKPRRSRRSARGLEKVTSCEETTMDWVHDPSKWGNPAQSWTTAERCLWLLYVVKQERGINELSASVVANTLRKHFRQAGLVYANIVARELGKLKMTAPAPVGEDSTEKPTKWFLTDEGIKRVETMIVNLRIQSAQSPT